MQRRVTGIREIRKEMWQMFVSPATAVYLVAKGEKGYTVYKEIPNVIDLENMSGEVKYRYEATLREFPREGDSLELS